LVDLKATRMTTKKIKDEIEGKKRKGNEKNGGG
jgi:hypothetical protein